MSWLHRIATAVERIATAAEREAKSTEDTHHSLRIAASAATEASEAMARRYYAERKLIDEDRERRNTTREAED